MATVNLYIRPEMNDQQGFSPIYLVFQDKGKKFKHYTGYKILPDFWDSLYQRANSQAPDSLVINENILGQKEKLIEMAKAAGKNGGIDVSQIKKAFTNGSRPEKKNEFYTHFEQFILSSKENKKGSTIAIYQALLRDLRLFDNREGFKLDFKKINASFYQDFTSFLEKHLDNTNNTISKKIKTLKAFLHYAAEKKLIEAELFSNFSTKTTAAVKVSLTEQEVSKIFNLNLSLTPELAQARDLFLFGCFTGMKYSEISKLKHSDVEDYRIKILNQYNNKEITVPMNNYAKMILRRYEYHDKVRCFPHIPNVYANKYVKELGRQAGISKAIDISIHKGKNTTVHTRQKYELITTDTARFTYAALSLQGGMRPELLIQILGQKNINSLLQYTFENNPMKDIEMIDCWNKKVF